MAKKKVAKRPAAKAARRAIPTTHRKGRYEGVPFEADQVQG